MARQRLKTRPANWLHNDRLFSFYSSLFRSIYNFSSRVDTATNSINGTQELNCMNSAVLTLSIFPEKDATGGLSCCGTLVAPAQASLQ